MDKLFNSRKNSVRLEDGIIIKTFVNEDCAICEFETLNYLHQSGLRVPKPIAFHKGEIAMEYIPGQLFPAIMEEYEEEALDITPMIKEIIDWLMSYYTALNVKVTNQNRGDVSLDNFIFTNNGVYSVDFEDESRGNIDQDFGKLVAKMLVIEPKNTSYKRNATSTLLSLGRKLAGVDIPRAELAFFSEIAELQKLRKQTLTGITFPKVR